MVLLVRHSDIEVVKSMAKHAKIPVINAMTSENHPCEIIADLYALSKLHIDIEKKKFLFVRNLQIAAIQDEDFWIFINLFAILTKL